MGNSIGKFIIFWNELRKFLGNFWSLALNFIGLGIIVYGGNILFERIRTGLWKTEASETVNIIIAILAAVIIFVGFVVAITVAAIKSFRDDTNKGKAAENSSLVRQTQVPYLNIQIDSKDIRYMDAKQIDTLFKGIKRSLVEYRRALKK